MRPIRQGVVLWPSSKPGGYGGSEIGSGAKTFAQLFPGGSLASIRAQGFDTIRVLIEQFETLEAASAGTKATYISNYTSNVATLIAADFNVVVCPAGFSTFNGNFWDGLNGALFTRFKAIWAQLAASLAALNRADRVGLELYNEPFTISQASLTPYYAPLIASIRQYADKESIFIPPTGYQSLDNMITLPGSVITDSRISASFHEYPTGWQAGVGGNDYHKGFGGWVIPYSNSNKTAALAVADAVGAALGSTAPQITTVKNNEVTPYYDTPKGQTYMNNRVASVATWASGIGLNLNKVLPSESGCTGDSATVTALIPASALPAGVTYANRKNGYGMLKQSYASQGLGACWQQMFYPEDGGISQGMMTDNTNFVFDAGIVDAIRNGTVV